MTSHQILILLLMTIYAVYRQSIRHELHGGSRFKLAIVYAAIGVVAGGFDVPPDAGAWMALLVGLLASVLIGIARGSLTRLFFDADGRIFSQGTPLTIGLFLLLVLGKFAWGAWSYFQDSSAYAGFGEVLLMIAVMVAMQAEIVWRRALRTTRAGAPIMS